MEHGNFGSGCRTPLLPSRLPSKPVKQATADVKTRRCPTSNKGDAQPCRGGWDGKELSGPGSGRDRRCTAGGKGRPCPPGAAPAPADLDPLRAPRGPPAATQRSRGPAAGGSGSRQPRFSLLAPPRSRAAAGYRGHSGGSSALPARPRDRPGSLLAPSAPPTARARRRGRSPRAHLPCPPSPPPPPRDTGAARSGGSARAPAGLSPPPGGAHVTRPRPGGAATRLCLGEFRARARVSARRGRAGAAREAGCPPAAAPGPRSGREGRREGGTAVAPPSGAPAAAAAGQRPPRPWSCPRRVPPPRALPPPLLPPPPPLPAQPELKRTPERTEEK
ncbi:PREDICTED: atherin-like [Sturnus vulgaris]|uniref:atherin-like n=1 Tax=Sturnus vulgaris TaxID=9172 RepID=UPI00071AA5E6|nr:PREDICTED: atherin-like [Sturnus vulgaris]